MDRVLRGATLVDGSGGPERRADVGITAGRVTAVGEISATDADGAEVVDLTGLHLTPGFVDAHTHFDAQVLWDPDLTPSNQHGVTSAVMGNCGFGIAPARVEGRERLARMLEHVEGMSFESLAAGIDWRFESFPEYLDVVEAAPKRFNLAALVPHSAVRLYVMGQDASEREATAAEVEAQRAIVAEALAAGAVGVSSSHATVHIGEHGRPVPTRLASADEINAVMSPLRGLGRGTVEFTPGPGFDRDEIATLARDLGRPVIYAGVLEGFHGEETAPEVLRALHDYDAGIVAGIACHPIVFQITMVEPFNFANLLPSFAEILSVPAEARPAKYRDPEWRARARAEAAASDQCRARWPKMTVVETGRHHALVDGPSIAEIAATRGVDPVEAIVDLALEDDMLTRYRVVVFNDDEAEVGELLRDPTTLICLSDAGAHASQICDAYYSTYPLAHWVRDRGVLSLPEAVRRLSSQVADTFGLPDRGRVAPGYWADLVAFDLDGLGLEHQERRFDLPAGADRLVIRSRGFEHVWVNGTPTRAHGADLAGVRPGVLIRG